MALGSATASSGYSTTGGTGASGGPQAASQEDSGYSISTLRQQYLDFHSAKSAEIEEQRVARHYYSGDQLTSDQLTELRKRRQPPTIRNKIDRKINGVVGLIERLRQDPKAFPRTPKHEDGAEIATAVIRYVLDVNQWESLSSNEARDGAINGIFGVELGLEAGDQGDPDITLGEIDNDTFFYDPRSFRLDFSDARYMGVAKWVDLDVAKEMFPDKADELESLITRAPGSDSVQQQDREFKWVDTQKERVFLIEHWHIAKGEWRYCFWCGDTKLASGPSPFRDEKDKSICRYVVASVNVDHDGDRYGFVRNLKSLQDEVNARASKGLHLLNTRRIIMEEGAVDDVDTLRREMVRPDGVIVRNPSKELVFDDQKTQADLMGQVEWMREVKDEIENFGPNPALIGQGIENKSGRAIALLQQAGIAELGPFILTYRNWKIRVYRAIWNAVQDHWTAERWIRVTDDEGAARFMGVNMMQMDPMSMRPQLVSVGQDGQAIPTGGLDTLDVDILLDEGPDTINLMQDSYDALTAMATAGSDIPPQVLIELSPLQASVKRKVLSLLEQANQPSPFDEKVMEIKTVEAEGKARKVNAEADKISREAETIDASAMRDRASAFKDVTAGAREIAQARSPQPVPADLGGKTPGGNSPARPGA